VALAPAVAGHAVMESRVLVYCQPAPLGCVLQFFCTPTVVPVLSCLAQHC
jgi:hypothetical protein